jgi:hypothetical protein
MIDEPTLLIPIDASSPEDPPQALVDLLEPLRIVVLGHYPVPDQSTPRQLQAAHEQEAKDAMEPIVRRFAAQGADVESVLVFTRDHVTSIDRVANEHDCDAVLVPGSVGDLSNVLVSLKDEQNMFRVLEVVGLLLEETDPDVTLFHSESVEKGSAISELLLRGATDWLTERGLARERITWREPTAETQTRDLLELAEAHDFVITGESEPSLAERVLGDLPGRIHSRTGRAVLVVRKER